jgi:hypothetical protein
MLSKDSPCLQLPWYVHFCLHFSYLLSVTWVTHLQLAGTHAGVPANQMNTLAIEYIGVRLLYNVLYMTVRNETVSYLRTGAWCWSVAIPLYGLVRAGNLVVGGGN